MARIVVTGGTIECPHGGKLTLSSGADSLQVDGASAVTGPMVVGLAFGSPEAPVPNQVAPCPVKTSSSPPVPSPCISTLAPTSGLANVLAVDQQPVLLETASGPVVNLAAPGGTWKVGDPGQRLLEEG